MGDHGLGEGFTTHVDTNSVRKGHVILLDGHPCKVSSLKKSRPGKHGHAKTATEGYDIFTGKKHTEILRHDALSVVCNKNTYMLMDITEEGYLSLLDDSGEEKTDLMLPSGNEKLDQLAADIRSKYEEGVQLNIEVQTAMGKEQVCDFKEDK